MQSLKTCQTCWHCAELTRQDVLIWCSHGRWAGWHTLPACKGEAWRPDDNRPRGDSEVSPDSDKP